MTGIDRDLLALLIVRLDSDRPVAGDLCWHPWDQAGGHELHGLSEEALRNPVGAPPFKRFPGDDNWPYFNSHVSDLLFPPGNRRGGRWLCCPDDVVLDIHQPRGPRWRAHVDLLERLTTPLKPGCTFGLIHLSLQCPEDSDAEDLLWWSWALRSGRRPSRVALQNRGEELDLTGRRPIRALAEELFGDPHRYLDQSIYTVFMARYQPVGARNDEQEWRRALGRLRGSAKARAWGERDQDKEDRQTVRYMGATGVILGNCTAFTLTDPLDGAYARNLRSYWGESILFGLLQQECLEDFQRRLAEVGDPLTPEIEGLHRDWLSFRNRIWWSQLSSSTDVPQELISRLRGELGTERLFSDLEGDLATYSSLQHRRAEDEQAHALANLQVYGSGLVVLSTLATILSLFDAHGLALGLLIFAALVVAVATSVLVRRQLRS